MTEIPLWIWPVVVCALAGFFRVMRLGAGSTNPAHLKSICLPRDRIGIGSLFGKLSCARFLPRKPEEQDRMRVVQRVGLGPQQQLVQVASWGREWMILVHGTAGASVLAERVCDCRQRSRDRSRIQERPSKVRPGMPLGRRLRIEPTTHVARRGLRKRQDSLSFENLALIGERRDSADSDWTVQGKDRLC